MLAAFAEVFADVFLDGFQHLLVAHARAGGEGRDLDEDADEADALHALLEVGIGRDLFRDLHGVEIVNLQPLVADELLAIGWDVAPDVRRIGLRALDEHAALGRDAVERIAEVEGVHVVERNELDVVQLAVCADVRVGDSEVIGRGQALLLGAVLWIRLHVEVEQLADESGDELVRRDAAEAAH